MKNYKIIKNKEDLLNYKGCELIIFDNDLSLARNTKMLKFDNLLEIKGCLDLEKNQGNLKFPKLKNNY